MNVQDEIISGELEKVWVDYYPAFDPDYWRLHAVVWLPVRKGRIKMTWRVNSDWMAMSHMGVALNNVLPDSSLDEYTRGHCRMTSELAIYLDGVSGDACMLAKLDPSNG
jgi:hypothetical protein